MPTGIYPRHRKPCQCPCGEKDEKRFMYNWRTLCRKCQKKHQKEQALQRKPYCRMCGTTESEKFYPYMPSRCKKCLYHRQRLEPNPEQRHRQYVNSKNKWYRQKEYTDAQRAKLRQNINRRQRARRKVQQHRLFDKMECDARRVIGKSVKKLDAEELYVLFLIRLTKLRYSGILSIGECEEKLTEFEKGIQFDVCLSLYEYKMKTSFHLKKRGFVPSSRKGRTFKPVTANNY